MTKVEASPTSLSQHFASTYHSLRLGIAVIGISLPALLWVGGKWFDNLSLLGSMSAYYHESTRDVFVGALCAVGVALYLYKGFSRAENLSLNAAGVLAVCIAMFPTAKSGIDFRVVNYVHVISAVLFFLALAYVSVFRASDTLSLIRPTSRGKKLQYTYRTLGGLMVASPVLAIATAWLLRPRTAEPSNVFFLEAFGAWTFGAYWLVKSWELKQTSAERAAAQGILQAVPEPAPDSPVPGKLMQIAPLDDSVEELHQRIEKELAVHHGADVRMLTES
jgi:hypothetical protein